MKIKCVDLAAQNLELGERVGFELDQIHSFCAYVGGHQVEKFEQEFAEFLGVKRAVGVANGTDALRIALLALGNGPGDEVITVPMTFIATAASIVQTGARPGFVDMERLWPERSATRDASASTPAKTWARGATAVR